MPLHADDRRRVVDGGQGIGIVGFAPERRLRAAGREPVERDSLYATVRTFAPDDPIFTATAVGNAAGAAGGAVPELVQLVGTGRA